MRPAIDVFADLSASRLRSGPLLTTIEKWARPESLGAVARRVTGVLATGSALGHPLRLRSGWVFSESEKRVSALSAALAEAGRDGVPLLLLLGPTDICAEACGLLDQCLERDPMFGFAVPRIGCADGCCFARLTGHGVGPTEWLPRRILAELPEREVLVEVASPCILIAPQVLGNFGPLDRQFHSIVGAILCYMASARRCGFRTVLSNRTIVNLDGLGCQEVGELRPLAPLSVPDRALLRQRVPDLERSWQEFRGSSWERFERLSAPSATTVGRPSLLLDIRNVGPIFNGTTQAVLGLVNALKALEPKWDVALLANPHGSAFHGFTRTYPNWPLYMAIPDRAFTATLRPSQPWHIQEMMDLHTVSLFNVYLMLDTIAWDVAYCAPPHLEGIWQFLADYADGLLFDSTFTRLRFLERFPSGRSVPALVTGLSFDPNDYTHHDALQSANRDFILVIGNGLDHKDVRPTVEAIATAFPFRHIQILGPSDIESPFVTAHQSGDLPELELHRLYANAAYIVFPSFYEGFGFPIVTALAYGRTVLARRSALLDEVASACERRGRLVTFDRRDELVELLGRLAHREAVPDHPLGHGRTGTRTRNWRDVAHDTLGFLDRIVRDPSQSRWITRERAARQLTSYRS